MSVQRFVGANNREVMRQVRVALGEDALILASRQVAEGVEILAMAEQDVAPMTGGAVASPAAKTTMPEAASPPAAGSPAMSVPSTPSVPPAASTRPSPAEETDFSALGSRLLSEMQGMRELLSRHPIQPVPEAADSAQARLRRCLLGAGFSQRLAAEVLAGLPPELAQAPQAAAMEWLERQLCARLPVPHSEFELLDGGGLIALIGPTGVGKTTTTGKLAAHYVMRHGGDGLALVSTDSYRVGAQEQLRIYAEILGVEMHALAEGDSLEALLAGLAHKRLVLVDTVGMSQRDQRLVEQVAQLRAGGQPVRLLLLLNAASQGETLAEVVETYGKAARAAGARLEDCVLTKQDEAARLGPLLDTVIRQGLRPHWVSCGQRVPEDLVPVEPRSLIRQGLAVGPGAADDTAPLMETPERSEHWSRNLLGQGRALAATLTTLAEQLPGFALLQQAWELSSLPVSVQSQRLSALCGAVPELDWDTVLWARQRPAPGCSWVMPDLVLAGRGLPLPLSRRSGMDLASHLAWVADSLGVRAHILSGIPDPGAWQWLEERELPWLAVAHANTRVRFRGERQTLAQLPKQPEPAHSHEGRYRGQPVQVELSRWPVTVKSSGEMLQAWGGELRALDSGLVLGRRYWLAPVYGEDDDSIALLCEQLRRDEVSVLTRQAWSQLDAAGLAGTDGELMRFLSASLASLACQLEQTQADWAMDVRAQLISLLGRRRSCNGRVLLDALVHLFTARDAIRQMGIFGTVAPG
ncbi:flagellar biosynthesis protein FlhF [Zobellella aerophila]|uniref:Flagellar biosynthesis protein FlhF n=1 Tax=Zobellella aerophila TaxID=870480 RepID=A0ABP6VW81_9GAMM